MRSLHMSVIFLVINSLTLSLQPQTSGENIFKTTCAACHTIKKGRLVGPDLSGIYQKMDNDWLIRFIRSSQQMIKAGDSAALAVFHEYKQIPMPDNRLTDDQIVSIIDYIRKEDGASKTSVAPLPAKQETENLQYTSEMVPLGRALFNGNVRFVKGASPCNSCHYINDLSIIGGGKLAIELTGAYTKLGPEGLRAILASPPFPAMQGAMKNRPLEEKEVHALISLLKSTSERPFPEQAFKSPGLIFLILSSVCALFILVHIYILYDNRSIS